MKSKGITVSGLLPISISIMLTIIVGIILGTILRNYVVGWFDLEKYASLLSFLLIPVFAIGYLLITLDQVPYKNLGILVAFGKRFQIFFDEGYWGLVIPFVISLEKMSVREITIGREERGGQKIYVPIKAQTRDDAEVEIEYATQIKITNPILWYNTEEPLETIENKFLGQLRIIISMFNAGDLNQLKSVVAGLLAGKSYAVQRLADSFLLKNVGGNIIVIDRDELREDLKNDRVHIAKLIKEEAEGVNPFTDADNKTWDPQYEITEYSIEMIPASIFANQSLKREAERVGGSIEPPAIKDITPPEEIRKAGLERQKERLETQAREEETRTHVRLALMEIGKNPDDPNCWRTMNSDDWDRYQRAKAEIRVREKTADEIIVRSIDDSSKDGADPLSLKRLSSHIVASSRRSK